MTDEGKIQSAIVKVLTLRGHEVIRLPVGTLKTMDGRYMNTGIKPGTPDLIVLRKHDNLGILIEVKTKTGKLSETQKKRHAQLEHDGRIVGIARSVEEALAIVEGRDKDEIGRNHS